MGRMIIGIVVLVVWCQASYVLPIPLQEDGGGGGGGGGGGRRVCVVGAGVAGLVTARHVLQDAPDSQLTVLEATEHVGGTWRYEPRVGLDDYGRPIHTSMYKHLRTNVPRQVMELPGFPMAEDAPSFPSGAAYYRYLLRYVDHFDLRRHVKLLHEVMLVSRVGDAWRVVYRDVAADVYYEQYFDYVVLCVGHYSRPNVPDVPGVNMFRGTIIHSHDYREPEPYTDRRVLIVGAGPSALDLATTLTGYSRRVVHSHHSGTVRTAFPDNYVHKPDVMQYTPDGVIFKDGTHEAVDDVIYGTGYEFNFPFLDDSCGLLSQPRYLAPLYNHVVNVQHPSMLVVGLVFGPCAIITTATQAQYAASIVAGRASLPPQQTMYLEWRRRADEIAARGKRPFDVHVVQLGPESMQYYDNVTSEGRLPRVPPVLTAVCKRDADAKAENFYTFRDYTYTVLDEEHFERVLRPPRACSVDLLPARNVSEPPAVSVQQT